MTSHELVNFLFGLRVQVLELVQVSLDVEAVRCDHVGLALDEVFSLAPSNVRNSRKHVRKVGSRPFNAIPADRA